MFSLSEVIKLAGEMEMGAEEEEGGILALSQISSRYKKIHQHCIAGHQPSRDLNVRLAVCRQTAQQAAN